jgi:adenylate cyclase class IV
MVPAALRYPRDMARNIEIKARIPSVQAVVPQAAAIAAQGPIPIAQDDTFFACANGRLKLRQFSPAEGELIFYRRADEAGPKESFYLRSPTPAPDVLRESLALAYGVTGRVRKQRTLFLAGRTRIHLDEVEGLGAFLELEVVLREDEAAEDGVREAHELMRRLGIEEGALVRGAYVDLLHAAGGATPTASAAAGSRRSAPPMRPPARAATAAAPGRA